MTRKPVILRSAYFGYGADDTSKYRYALGRWWNPLDPDHTVTDTWIMMNPSTADAYKDDPTVSRCIAFSQKWGADGLRVLNGFALRSTDPALLLRHPDPVGPENDAVIETLVAEAGGRVIVAWGAHPMAAIRGREVVKLLGVTPLCLGTNRDGSPKHPLYVPGNTQPVPWRPR